METRVITIKNSLETWEMKFDPDKLKDSEALHHLLGFVDPGEEYTVQFKNVN
jgi:hypothetical protein